jgi:hypothetical protein
MPPILVDVNLLGWLSLGGLTLSLALMALWGLHAAGVSVADLTRQERALGLAAVLTAAFVVWAVATLLYCELTWPAPCQPLAHLLRLSAR